MSDDSNPSIERYDSVWIELIGECPGGFELSI